MFDSKKGLLEKKGSFIIRCVCVYVCVFVCVFVCVYVRVCVCVWVCYMGTNPYVLCVFSKPFSPHTHTRTCRHLCVYVDAHSVYCTLAEILYTEENLDFASLMVQVLNMILFTAMELYELRMQLRDLETQVR